MAGYHVTVNCHNGDRNKIQVLITGSERTTVDYVDMQDLDAYIKEHTK